MQRIRMNGRAILQITLSVLLSVLFVAITVSASSTISTNINTGGTLTVSGATSLEGNSTLGNASTDVNLFTGTLQASTTALFTNGATFYSTVTLQNGESFANSTDGTITVTADVVKLVGTASSSAIIVGDEPAAPTINGLVHGYCSFANVTSFTASTTKYFDCTTTPTLALTTSDRIFLQATSSWDQGFIIEAASSTGVSTINIRALNTGMFGDTTLGATSINFWAVR